MMSSIIDWASWNPSIGTVILFLYSLHNSKIADAKKVQPSNPLLLFPQPIAYIFWFWAARRHKCGPQNPVPSFCYTSTKRGYLYIDSDSLIKLFCLFCCMSQESYFYASWDLRAIEILLDFSAGCAVKSVMCWVVISKPWCSISLFWYIYIYMLINLESGILKTLRHTKSGDTQVGSRSSITLRSLLPSCGEG